MTESFNNSTYELPKEMIKAELARFLGVTVKYVEELIERGVIVPCRTRGKKHFYDPIDSRNRVNRNKDVALSSKVNQEIGDAPEKPEGAKPGGKTFAEYRTEKEKWNSKKAEIEYKEKAKKLVEVAAVRKVAFETAKIIRDNLAAIPDRLSHELAAETNPGNIGEILEREIFKSLEELSRNAEKFN